MTAPGPAHAVAALRRCLKAGDYAGAARLIEQPATLSGLDGLGAYAAAQRAEADRARGEAAAARLGEAERARVQAVIAPLLDEVIGVLAGALGMPRGPVCVKCRRVLGRRRNCPYCGTRDARSAGWPASREEAA